MRFLIALPLLAIAAPVWGQANIRQECQEEDHAAFPPGAITVGCQITVTGNLWQSRSESTEAIIKTPQISGRLENDLSRLPGLQQFRRSDARSANPTSQGITLRGLGGNASSRAALILDDVPQADPFGGWISWPGYDALNLASIRVRKGAGLVSVGPGALAGTIELDSLQGVERISGNLSYGSRNSVDAKAALLADLGQGSISLSGSYARGDGFVPVIEGQRGAVDRAAPYEQMGIALRGVAPLSDNAELQASLRAFSDERDRGFDFSDNQNSGVDASLRLVKRSGDWQWSALGYVQIRDFASRFGAIAADRSSVGLTLDQYEVPSTGLGARFEVRPPLGDDAELRIGGEWRRTVGETKENSTFTGMVPSRNRIAGGQTDTLGGFAEASFKPLDELTLTAGGRADYWRIANGFRKEVNIGGTVRSDDVFADRSGWEGTGRVGFAYDALDNLKLRGSAYTGWRLPTLNELYRPFRVGADATAANELLSPERIKGAEVGVDFEKDRLSISATAFLNRLSNAIGNVSQGAGPGNFPGVGFVAAGGVYRKRENLDAIDGKGIEIDATLDLGPVTLRAGYAYIDAQVVSDGLAVALNGLRPAQVPSHFANASIAYDGSAFNADVTLRYVGAQYEDDLNSQRLPDALTLDAGISYDITPTLAMTLRGENIFDAEVQAAISSTGIIERASPRTIWFGIRFATR